MHTVIEDPADFFLALGGMHDAKFHARVNHADTTLMIDVDDIHANFLDLPEYSGKHPATFTFFEVKNICMDEENKLSINDRLNEHVNERIYDIQIKSEKDTRKNTLTMLISPGGRLVFDFSTVSLEYSS